MNSHDSSLFVASPMQATAPGVPQITCPTARRGNQETKQNDAKPVNVAPIVPRRIAPASPRSCRKCRNFNGKMPSFTGFPPKAWIIALVLHAHAQINATGVSMGNIQHTNICQIRRIVFIVCFYGNKFEFLWICGIQDYHFNLVRNAFRHLRRHTSLGFGRTSVNADKQGHVLIEKEFRFGGDFCFGQIFQRRRVFTQPRIVGGQVQVRWDGSVHGIAKTS